MDCGSWTEFKLKYKFLLLPRAPRQSPPSCPCPALTASGLPSCGCAGLERVPLQEVPYVTGRPAKVSAAGTE